MDNMLPLIQKIVLWLKLMIFFGSAPKAVVCALTFVWFCYNTLCGFATAKIVVLLQCFCGLAPTNFVVYGKNEKILKFTIYLFIYNLNVSFLFRQYKILLRARLKFLNPLALKINLPTIRFLDSI